MTYSGALWNDGDDLEAAQTRKLDHHIECAHAAGAARVLDIGCGWGSLLARLRAHDAQQVLGLTLSAAQARAIASRGWEGVAVRLESWSGHVPCAPYDAIVSIGAMEHFAGSGLDREAQIGVYREFFRRCHDWLEPGGRISLQTIVYENATGEDVNEFLSTEVFPNSELPHLADIVKASEHLFEVETVRNDRRHYAQTLRAWLAGLRARRGAAKDLVGEETVARYERYLALAMIGFHGGALNLSRLALRRIDTPRAPTA